MKFHLLISNSDTRGGPEELEWKEVEAPDFPAVARLLCRERFTPPDGWIKKRNSWWGLTEVGAVVIARSRRVAALEYVNQIMEHNAN